jgi:hypothetical protein
MQQLASNCSREASSVLQMLLEAQQESTGHFLGHCALQAKMQLMALIGSPKKYTHSSLSHACPSPIH